jgi:hypothetical protein
LDGWPKAPKKFQQAIESSIAEGELAASLGKRTPDLSQAALAAMAAYGAAPDKITFAREYVDYVPYAASRVSFACQESNGLFAHDGLESAMSAVFYFERARKQRGLVRKIIGLLWKDFERLEAASADGKWKSTTPVPPDASGPLWPDGPPEGWPEDAPPVLKPKAKPAAIDLKELRLPKDLVAFLTEGKRLKYNAAKTEVGPIVLKPIDHLRVSDFEASANGAPAQDKDPNRAKRGHYLVRAIDLVAECDAYGPEGILAWLPDYKCFGQWDPDHQRVMVFPKTKWSQIVANPARYLDAQWRSESEDFARDIEPWKHGSFKRAKR